MDCYIIYKREYDFRIHWAKEFVYIRDSLITGLAGTFADYVKRIIGFENEFLWHLIIVVVTVGLCCCIADIYIILRSVVTASFSSMVQKRVREVMKND